jgi:hypothetical protein
LEAKHSRYQSQERGNKTLYQTVAKYYFTTFAFYALLRYFHHRPRSVRGGVNAASITTTAAATITSSSTAATVESQKKTRGGKGS